MKESGLKTYNRQYGAQTLIAAFLVCAGILFAVVGEDAQIAVQDNLDLFQAQYRMLQNTDTFASRGTAAPFLGGISRDVLPSERELTGILYQLLPAFPAYLVLYFLRILIGTAGMYLLVREILHIAAGKDGQQAGITDGWEKQTVLLVCFAYGLISFFPAFGICFASIPLAALLFIRLYRSNGRERKTALAIAGLFFYPFLSYFSYHGIFILGYAALAWLILAFRDRRINLRMIAGIAALAAGYVFFEYRLFAQMLLSDEVTIRETMVMTSATVPEAIAFMKEAFADGMMHAQGQQKYLVLPVCLLYFVYEWLCGGRILSREESETSTTKTLRGIRFWILMWILFNSLVYGLYYLAPVRSLVKMLLPPLKGLQFNRTIFFNPFLWYLWYLLVLVSILRGDMPAPGRAAAGGGARTAVCIGAAFLSAAIVLFSPVRYNDLYHTAYAKAYELLRGGKVNDLSYGEFYSERLFAEIKEDIGYREGNFADFAPYAGSIEGEAEYEGSASLLAGSGADWAVAYGLHPAILEYNGIATLDGYLGFYAQSYKESFRRIIAPALDARPATRAYYDDWGARCYLYSGTEDTVVQAVRRYPYAERSDYEGCFDAGALRELGCRYVFSRIPFSNAQELGLALCGRYEDASSPYVIYVYEPE